MIVKTESGSAYEFDESGLRVRRVREAPDGEMRRDGEWLAIFQLGAQPRVGERLMMVLDVREDSIETYRVTTPVTEIRE